MKDKGIDVFGFRLCLLVVKLWSNICRTQPPVIRSMFAHQVNVSGTCAVKYLFIGFGSAASDTLHFVNRVFSLVKHLFNNLLSLVDSSLGDGSSNV